MPVKIRLSRHGRKGRPFYHIVIADSRAPRDGRFIEKVGTYNPMTNPATIDLKFDRALKWLQTGAQPTDTARSILSKEGVLYKNHLLKGVRKGALTEAEAEAKFEKWKAEKDAKKAAEIQAVKDARSKESKKRLAVETKIREERAKVLAAKNSDLAKALGVEVKISSPEKTETTAEATADKAEEAKQEETKQEETKTEE